MKFTTFFQPFFSLLRDAEKMRFLSQCVCCCKPTKRTHPAGDEEEEPPSPASRAEATQLLIPPGALIRRQRKRRGLGAAAAADWRPSLFAIAEDTSVRVAPPDNRRFVESPTNFDFKQRRCFSARVDARTLLSEFEREDHQMSVPSLSAAPFMMF
ncbi:hypothetical protein Cgig2_023427 [Carnegiea gigantea]|uniref:Uncharacterized protein n=1 Tax=Carnegiea gigantea TaxID=171969 RepID=A0A9Q1K425_9CARY|nr:hypothetical protein Cgig2_023427 [Carnegiea gigantea]